MLVLQGGRNSNNPVLREDVFLLKVKALGGRKRRPKAAAQHESDGQGFGEGGNVEPWARSQAQLAQHRVSAAQAGGPGIEAKPWACSQARRARRRGRSGGMGELGERGQRDHHHVR